MHHFEYAMGTGKRVLNYAKAAGEDVPYQRQLGTSQYKMCCFCSDPGAGFG